MLKPKKNKLYSNRKRRQSEYHFYNKDITALRKHIDILEVVQKYVPLKASKNNLNFHGVCPFCKPDTFSPRNLCISKKKQLFKCFRCGLGGHVFGFIMKYHNIPFDRAFMLLKKQYYPDLQATPIRRDTYRFGYDIQNIKTLETQLKFVKETMATQLSHCTGEDSLPF